MNTIYISLITIAIFVFIVFRQLKPRRMNRFSLVILPILAAYLAYQNLPQGGIPTYQVIEFICIAIVGIIVGLFQVRNTKVFVKENEMYMQGNIRSLLAWGALILSRMIINFTFSPSNSFGRVLWILWAGIAISFGVKSILLYRRYPQIGNYVNKSRK